MNLILSNIEKDLLKYSIMDTIVNSKNFKTVEKEYLENIYHQINDYDENE